MWDNLFDKTFREKANEGLPQLDKEAMWSALDKDLDKRNRKNGLAWIWFFGGMLLISAFALILGSGHQSFVAKHFATFAQQNKELESTGKLPTNSEITATDQIENYTIASNEDQNINQAKEDLLLNESNTIETNPSDISQKLINSNSKPPSRVIPNLDETRDAVHSDGITDGITEQNTRIEDEILTELKNQEAKNNRNEGNVIKPRSVFNTSMLPLHDLNFSSSLIADRDEDQIMDNQPIEVYPQRGHRWELSASTGFMLFSKSITQVNPELKEFVDFKNQSESEDFGISARILVGYKIKPNLKLRAGLQYMNFFERFEYDRTIDTEVTKFRENAFAYARRDGTTQIFSGDVPAVESTRRQVGHTNQHQMWNGIIEAAYSKKLGRLSAEIKSGFSASFAHSFKGKSIDGDIMPVEINENNSTELIGNSNSMSGYWHGGAGLSMPIARKLSLNASLQYNLGLNPVNKNVEDYKLTYKFYDGSIGLSYNF